MKFHIVNKMEFMLSELDYVYNSNQQLTHSHNWYVYYNTHDNYRVVHRQQMYISQSHSVEQQTSHVTVSAQVVCLLQYGQDLVDQ